MAVRRRRPRFVREGVVGLLALSGLTVMGGIILWLQGNGFGQQDYKLFVDFFSVSGLQVGSPVRFRGIKIGRVSKILPGANSAEIELTISPPSTLLPRGVLVEANQSGLISETSIDFTPLTGQRLPVAIAKPTDPTCDRKLILCSGDRLKGETGVSFDELIRTSVRFAEIYGDPSFIKNLNQTLANASKAAANLATLGTEMTVTARSLKSDLLVTSASLRTNLSTTANSLQTNFDGIQTNVSGLTQDLRGQIPTLSASVRSVGSAANRMSATTDELGALLRDNRSKIATTLDNFSQASSEFKVALARVSPILQRVEKGKMLDNLELFSENAAKASVSLKELVSTASNPGTLVVLYQLLDSARATFQNTQKLTSDLDEITGDPTFRRNLRDLIKGLTKLISSAETLEQETQVARLLTPQSRRSQLGAITADAANLPNTANLRLFSPKVAAMMPPLQIVEIPSPSSPGLEGETSTQPTHSPSPSISAEKPTTVLTEPNLGLKSFAVDLPFQSGQLTSLLDLLKGLSALPKPANTASQEGIPSIVGGGSSTQVPASQPVN